MNILVAVLRDARPGQVEAMIAAARARWEDRARWAPGRRAVRLLQSFARPDRTLYLAEWESVEAYRANRSERPTTALDALCVAPPTPQVYQRGWFFENMGRAPRVVNAAMYRTAPAAQEATRRYLTEVTRPRVREQPGLVLHVFYEHLEDSTQLLTLDGWSSPAALDAFERELVPVFEAERPSIGFTVERFVGRLRLAVQSWGDDRRVV